MARTTVTTDMLTALAVTAAKLAADAVETAKIKNDAVTTAKILDGNVTSAKLAAAVSILLPTVRRKTADEAVTSSVALQDDDHLAFPIGANEEWVADFEIFWENLAAGGLRLGVTTPSGATNRFAGLIVTLLGTSAIADTNVSSGTTFLSLSTGDDRGIARVSAWVLNGATPGNVTLQWAQAVSDASATRFFKGSHMIAHRIA